MKPPAAIIPVFFILLTTACGGNSTVSITPPQGSGVPAGSSSPAASQPSNTASPNTDTPIVPNSGCDPNYDPCVPVASDVDCEGGGGNGPAYVRGPVKVIGNDKYQLDRDGNGIGCEKK